MSLINRSKFIRPAATLLLAACITALSGCGSAASNESEILLSSGVGRVIGVSYQTPAPETEDVVALPKNGITICVDPGHGFDDGGAESELLGDVLEKDINLAVSELLRDHLELLGFDVIMTHDGSEFPRTASDDGNNKFNPMERTAYANSLGSEIDYYISLHCNSSDMTEAEGTRIYYYEGFAKATDTDLDIADTICAKIENDFPDSPTPVCENSEYYVVKYTKVPASLVEMGFITNENDATKMTDPEWQDKLAASIASGIAEYYSESGAASV